MRNKIILDYKDISNISELFKYNNTNTIKVYLNKQVVYLPKWLIDTMLIMRERTNG